MGFEVPEPRHLRLVFSDPSFHGLEVVCRMVPVGQLSEAASLAEVDTKNPRPEDAAKVQRLFDAFAAALVSWNLTRNGRKVPATKKGVDSLDPLFVSQLVEAWISAVGKVVSETANSNGDLEQSLSVEALG